MKKTLLVLFTFLASAACALAQDTPHVIEGNYVGDLYVSLFNPINDETEKSDDACSVNIVADGENTVTFALYNFAFAGMPVGDIVLKSVPVSEGAEQSVVFGENAPTNLELAGGEILATAQINTATSAVAAKTLTADIDVVWTNAPGEPAPIYVRFVGGYKGTPTGIDAVETAKRASGVYSLAGVRLGNSTQGLPKGIYIVDGQKKFVK